MTERKQIEAAKQALPKATEPLRGEEQYIARKTIEKTDLALLRLVIELEAWQREAVPWLVAYKTLLCDDDSENRFHVDDLDALIGRAKG